MECRTQTELGRRLGVTQSRVSQILSGSYPVKKGPLLTLIRTLQAEYVGKRPAAPVSVAQRSLASGKASQRLRRRKNR